MTNKIINLYTIGQQFRNPRNGEIFEIVNREILEEAHVTLYKIKALNHDAIAEMDGNKLTNLIAAGIEVL